MAGQLVTADRYSCADERDEGKMQRVGEGEGRGRKKMKHLT